MITVTELPIGTWTDDYKMFLDKLETEQVVYSYKNNCTETTVNFEIKFPLETVIEWNDNREIDKKLKLTSHLSSKNMHVFNEKNQIVKMENAEEIIYHFWRIRNEYYIKRKEHLCKKLQYSLDLLKNKIRFVNDIMEDHIVVFRQKLEKINSQLTDKKYTLVENSYKYLTDMKIHSFSEETISELTVKRDALQKEYDNYLKYTLRDFWINDIN